MITEQYKDKVYFSKWFKSDYPDIYHNVCNYCCPVKLF